MPGNLNILDAVELIESWTRLMAQGFNGTISAKDLPVFEMSLAVIIACLLMVIAALWNIIEINQQIAHQKALRESVMGSQMIPAQTFLSNWKTTRSDNKKPLRLGQGLYTK